MFSLPKGSGCLVEFNEWDWTVRKDTMTRSGQGTIGGGKGGHSTVEGYTAGQGDLPTLLRAPGSTSMSSGFVIIMLICSAFWMRTEHHISALNADYANRG